MFSPVIIQYAPYSNRVPSVSRNIEQPALPRALLWVIFSSNCLEIHKQVTVLVSVPVCLREFGKPVVREKRIRRDFLSVCNQSNLFVHEIKECVVYVLVFHGVWQIEVIVKRVHLQQETLVITSVTPFQP